MESLRGVAGHQVGGRGGKTASPHEDRQKDLLRLALFHAQAGAKLEGPVPNVTTVNSIKLTWRDRGLRRETS